MNDYISRETAIIEIERYAAELTPEWAPKQNIIIEDIENIIRACLESPRVRMAQSDFSPDDAKTAGNTLCINEDFGKIWRKICKPDVRGEILNRLLIMMLLQLTLSLSSVGSGPRQKMITKSNVPIAVLFT